MKNLETYLAPEVEVVYYLSGKNLCTSEESDFGKGDGGIELPDDTLG